MIGTRRHPPPLAVRLGASAGVLSKWCLGAVSALQVVVVDQRPTAAWRDEEAGSGSPAWGLVSVTVARKRLRRSPEGAVRPVVSASAERSDQLSEYRDQRAGGETEDHTGEECQVVIMLAGVGVHGGDAERGTHVGRP